MKNIQLIIKLFNSNYIKLKIGLQKYNLKKNFKNIQKNKIIYKNNLAILKIIKYNSKK